MHSSVVRCYFGTRRSSVRIGPPRPLRMQQGRGFRLLAGARVRVSCRSCCLLVAFREAQPGRLRACLMEVETGQSSTVDDANLRALGRVTLNFASLELAAQSVVATLLTDQRPDEAGTMVASKLSFSLLMSVFQGLVNHRTTDEAIRTEAADLRSKAVHAEQQRNKAVHSVWVQPEGESPIRVKIKMGKAVLQYQAEKMTTEQIDGVADFIGDVLQGWNRFARDRFPVVVQQAAKD